MMIKVTHESINYLIDEFPEDYKDMVKKISTKLNKTFTKEVSFSFIDTEKEKILLTDDSDLRTALKLAISTNSQFVRIIVERNLLEKSTSEMNTGATSDEAKTNLETEKFFKILYSQLPQVKQHFEQQVSARKLPCESCMGMGRVRNGTGNCSNCCGRGFRPKTAQMKLVMKLIDYKIKHLLLEPLQSYLGADRNANQEREADADSEDFEDDIFGGQSLSFGPSKLSQSFQPLDQKSSLISPLISDHDIPLVSLSRQQSHQEEMSKDNNMNANVLRHHNSVLPLANKR